jgi:FKBP-type peptidyl-prolyl cis-trans isomerase FkpA
MRKVIPILFLVLTTGCLNKPDSRSSVKPASEKDLIELNRSLITSDRELITDYIGKSDLKFIETETGLWYSIVEKGGGEAIKTGDDVSYSYDCKLIDGKPCYSGSNTLRVGYASVERGVTEGLQLMKPGSDYIFIIPPYLAHGLTGDGQRIPGRSILIYRIKIKEVI